MKKLVTLTAILLFVVTSMNAQNTRNVKWDDYGIQNIKNGITSENPGLKKSAIFMAGKYQLAETEKELLAVLKTENEECVKILTALSLYKIESKKGMKLVKNMAVTDTSSKVRKQFGEIYKVWSADNNYRFELAGN